MSEQCPAISGRGWTCEMQTGAVGESQAACRKPRRAWGLEGSKKRAASWAVMGQRKLPARGCKSHANRGRQLGARQKSYAPGRKKEQRPLLGLVEGLEAAEFGLLGLNSCLKNRPNGPLKLGSRQATIWAQKLGVKMDLKELDTSLNKYEFKTRHNYDTITNYDMTSLNTKHTK